MMKPNDFSLITPTGSTELYTQTNDITGKFTLEDLKAYLEASEWTETVINISSAQILSMGSSPIQLLPNAGLNKYYVFEGVLEFTAGSIQYNLSPELFFCIYYDSSFNKTGSHFITDILQSKYNSVTPFSSIPNVGTNGSQNGIFLNSSVLLSTQKANNPISGTGTIRIVLRYKVKTFGA